MRSLPTVVFAIAAAALVAGALDIGYACVFWAFRGTEATRIFQSVAAGLLGPAAFEGGARTAALGLALHFAIVGVMATVYYAAARLLPILWRRPLAFGSLYGVGLYVVMNYVVVPLSAASPGAKDALWIWLSVVVHAVFVGVPIAVITGWGARRQA